MARAAEKSSQTLIVVHGNRYMEVFSNDRQAVKIVHVPFATTREGELLIEELLELRLPTFWSKIYRDGHLVDRDAIRDMKATDILKRDYDFAILRAFDRIAASNEKSEVGTC
jgi:hypothetical protein